MHGNWSQGKILVVALAKWVFEAEVAFKQLGCVCAEWHAAPDGELQQPVAIWILVLVKGAPGSGFHLACETALPLPHVAHWVIGGESSETVPLGLSGPNLSEVTGKIITEDSDLWIDALPLDFQDEVSDSYKIHVLSCKWLDMH